MRKPFFTSLTALVLAMCLLLSVIPAQAAQKAGSASAALKASEIKAYVRLAYDVQAFAGDLYGTGTKLTVPAGAVCQLYSDDWYEPSDGRKYRSIYYLNKRYNVLDSDIAGQILSDSELNTYITGTLWKQTSYDTLRQNMGLVGDIRVHAVQLALQRLGYYTGKVDGTYGAGTAQAVKKFQRARGLSADGSAGPMTQPVLFALASGSTASTTTPSTGSTTTTTTVPSAGTVKTIASVNLRKGSSTSSERLAIIPRNVKLPYTSTVSKSGVTWFHVSYNGLNGWVMGTFVNASGSTSTPVIGTVTITKAGTRLRDAANGNKTGTVLAKGTVVDLLTEPISKANYLWYNVRTSSGQVGFVRGDCATRNTTSSSGSGSTGSGTSTSGGAALPTTSDKVFVRLPQNTKLFKTETMPASGYTTVGAGTVLMFYANTTYTAGGAQYASVYYNNEKYNLLYSDVKSGVMTTAEVTAYCNTLLSTTLTTSLKKQLNLVGDVRVYALQAALKSLNFFTDALDGTYGNATYTAVRNFQRSAAITIDGACGSETWATLSAKLNGSTSGSGSSSGSGSVSAGGSVTVADFGTVTSVQKAKWDYDTNGSNLFPKESYATVMDVKTGKVFRIFRWSGGSHADCVPATADDTRVMCDIVGFPYNSNHPTSTQLDKIKANGDSNVVTYTWPDFKNAFGGAKNIGSDWDRRPALLNIGGKVYCVSIYGFPHGFNGKDTFSKSKFPNGQYFYAANNFYGMMCVHFVGSKTHSGTSPDEKHQKSIEDAYAYAKTLWPKLCK